MNPADVTRATIPQYRQNRPTLICRDLLDHGVPEDVTARILMARGVGKWMACRRDLIRLKDSLVRYLAGSYERIGTKQVRRGTREYHRTVGMIKAVEICVDEIRKILHSDRWRWPDNDPRFGELLNGGRKDE